MTALINYSFNKFLFVQFDYIFLLLKSLPKAQTLNMFYFCGWRSNEFLNMSDTIIRLHI